MLAFSQKLGDGYLPCVILLMLILGLKQDGILPLTFVRNLSCLFSGCNIVLYESVKLLFGCKGHV